MNIYPRGYTACSTEIEQLMQTQPDLIMVDPRLKPWSRWPTWRQAALRATYGARYQWVGATLGNLH